MSVCQRKKKKKNKSEGGEGEGEILVWCTGWPNRVPGRHLGEDDGT